MGSKGASKCPLDSLLQEKKICVCNLAGKIEMDKMIIVRQIIKPNSQILSRWSNSISLKVGCNHLSTSTRRTGEGSSKNERVNTTSVPPDLPTTCCMSGCANCVWLDYAEETVEFYDAFGMKMELEELLKTVDDNIQDPLVKAFIKMELKSKYLFGSK